MPKEIRVRVSYRLPAPVRDLLRQLAKHERRAQTTIMVSALEQYARSTGFIGKKGRVVEYLQ